MGAPRRPRTACCVSFLFLWHFFPWRQQNLSAWNPILNTRIKYITGVFALSLPHNWSSLFADCIICKFAYLLKFTVIPEFARKCFHGCLRTCVCTKQWKHWVADTRVPGEARQGHTRLFHVSSPTKNKCPFHSLFGAVFSHLCALCWWFCCLNGFSAWCWSAMWRSYTPEILDVSNRENTCVR